MTTKDRLLEFIKYKKLSMIQFTKSIEVSQCYVQNIKNGIGSSIINRIATTYPELNIHWLTGGEGNMINSVPSKELCTDSIPLLPISAQAGRLSEFTMSVQEADCERIISPIKEAELAITVTGDSMSPEYPSGTKALIKKINEKAFIDWGSTYVLDTCNGVIIKNLFPGSSDSTVKCVSINAKYPSFEVSFDDIYGWYKVLMALSLK